MKKTIVFIIIIFALLTGTVSTNAQTSQTLVWSMVCDGNYTVTQIGNGNRIDCFEEVVDPTPTQTPQPTATPGPVANDRIIDRTDISSFPVPWSSTYRRQGSTIRVSYHHRSVGQMIDWGMGCLDGSKSTQLMCAPYTNQGYVNTHRGFLFNAGDWRGKMDEWEAFVTSNINNYDVFMMKLCYLDGVNSNPFYWADFSEMRDLYVRLSQRYPNKIFVLWTMPVYTPTGYEGIIQYNDQVREWANSGNMPSNVYMFDIASIESTRQNGTRCLNSSGDEIICSPEYISNSTGGHIIKSGGEWVARFIWVMLARIEADR